MTEQLRASSHRVMDASERRETALAVLHGLVNHLDDENLADATEYVLWLTQVQRAYRDRWGTAQGGETRTGPAA